jgi:hypothetical protein
VLRVHKSFPEMLMRNRIGDFTKVQLPTPPRQGISTQAPQKLFLIERSREPPVRSCVTTALNETVTFLPRAYQNKRTLIKFVQ